MTDPEFPRLTANLAKPDPFHVSPIRTVTFVEVDAPPVDSHKSALDGALHLDAEYDRLPHEFRARLLALVGDQFDTATCYACDNPVGYTLSGDADEHMSWHYSTLVNTGSKVHVACEDCTNVLVPPVTLAATRA